MELMKSTIVPVVIILLIGINYVVKAVATKKKYTKYINDINNAEEEQTSFGGVVFNKKVLSDEGLNLALNNFIKSAKGNTVDINTEVIIESSLDSKIISNERKVENGGAVCVAWGLLGTFVGLTLAIIQAKDAMSASSESMQAFVGAMEGPIEGMALAFATTIIGVICSLVVNKFSGEMKQEKEKFYGIFEDYLDNYIFSKYYFENEEENLLIDTFKQGLIVLTESFEKNMDRLVDKIENVFSVKMEKIIDKIDLNNEETRKNIKIMGDSADDIRRLVKKFDETVEGIGKTTKELNKTIKDLEKPINSFGDQIDKLEIVNQKFTDNLDKSMDGFNLKLDKTMTNFNSGIEKGVSTFNSGIEDSVLKFNGAISKAKDSMNEENERFTKTLDTSISSLNKVVEKSVVSSGKLGESIEQNNKINRELSDILNKEINMLDRTNSQLNETMERISRSSNENSEAVIKEIEVLTQTYSNLNKFMNGFEYVIEKMSVKTGEATREAINSGIDNLATKLNKTLEPSIEGLEKSTDGLLKANGDLIKVTSGINEAISSILVMR